jgi:Na+-driven multidrug efflux pump
MPAEEKGTISVLSFIINAMPRGAGEARWSMRVLLLSTATTVALEPVLVGGLGPLPPLGVVGSAWAFVLGYGAGLILQGWRVPWPGLSRVGWAGA